MLRGIPNISKADATTNAIKVLVGFTLDFWLKGRNTMKDEKSTTQVTTPIQLPKKRV
jgi:hypothetical protein